MSGFLQGFRRGRDRAYAELGPPPPFFSAKKREPIIDPIEPVDTGAGEFDGFVDEEPDVIDMPPPRPIDPDAEPGTNDTAATDAKNAAIAELMEAVEQLQAQLTEKDAALVIVGTEVEKLKLLNETLTADIERLEGDALNACSNSASAMVLESVRAELTKAYGANTALAAELRASEAACDELRAEMATLKGDARKQARDAAADGKIADRLWRDVSKVIHPDKAPAGATAKEALEAAFKSVQAVFDRVRPKT